MGRLRRLRRSCPNQHPVHTSVAHSAHAWRAWGHSDVPALQSHSDTGRPCSVGSKSSRPCRRTSPAPAGDNGSEQLRRPAAARQRLPHQFFGWAVALLFRFGSTSRCWPLLLVQLFPPGTKDSTVRTCHQAATQKGNRLIDLRLRVNVVVALQLAHQSCPERERFELRASRGQFSTA